MTEVSKEARKFTDEFFDALPHCCGYPKCDGDLPGQTHSDCCPMHGVPDIPLRDQIASCVAAFAAKEVKFWKDEALSAVRAELAKLGGIDGVS